MKNKKNKVKERFVLGNRVFIYDFNNVTVEAAEIISAIAELKYNQIQSPPTAFRQVLVSGGAEWRILIAACLLLEEKDGVLMPFDKDKALDDVANFVRNMPVAELERIDRCITDFFYNTRKEQMLLEIQSGEKKLSATEILLTLLPSLLQTNEGSGNLLNSKKD